MRSVLAVLAVLARPCCPFRRRTSRRRTSSSITIDTLRADALGFAGNRRATDSRARPPGRAGPGVHRRPRPQRGHAAVPRQHPDRALPVPARRPGQQRLPAAGDVPDARHRAARRGLRDRRRSSAPIRSTRSSASTAASTSTTTAPPAASDDEQFALAERRGDEVVAPALDVVESAARQAPLPLGPPLRPPRALRAAGAVRLPLRQGRPTWARSRPRTRSWRRCSARSSTARSRLPGGGDRRPRRGAGRSRRADARPLRLRGDAQGAAGRSGARACSRAGTRAPRGTWTSSRRCSQAAGVEAAARGRPAGPLAPGAAGRAGGSATSRRCRRPSTAAGLPCAACCAGAEVHRPAAARALRPAEGPAGEAEPDRRATGPRRARLIARAAAESVWPPPRGTLPAGDEERAAQPGLSRRSGAGHGRATVPRTIRRTAGRAGPEDPRDHRRSTRGRLERGGRGWRARWCRSGPRCRSGHSLLAQALLESRADRPRRWR